MDKGKGAVGKSSAAQGGSGRTRANSLSGLVAGGKTTMTMNLQKESDKMVQMAATAAAKAAAHQKKMTDYPTKKCIRRFFSV